jgi:hypothetical protein
MSEIINIEIQADQSGAEEALKQVNNSLKEGTEAAEALSHALDGDVAGAFTSLGELSKTLGIELGLAFSPAEIIAFVQIIAEVTDKVSKLIADTFIYTDEQKALDAQIKSSNQVIAGYAADIKKLNDEFEKMGKTASQKTAIDIAKLKTELEAANEAVYTLTGDLDQAKTKAADPNNINALGNANAIPGINNALGVAQQHQKVLLDQMRNLTAAFHIQQDAELEAMAEAEISGRLRVQEASVNAEKAKWDRIKELTHASADQNEAVETGFENRLYQVKREALRERLELMKLDPDHNAVAITALNREIEALAKEHEATLTRIKIEGDRERHRVEDQQRAALAKQTSDTMAQAKAENDAIIKGIDQQFQVWDEGYKGQIEVAKIASETKIQLITQDFEKGKITQQQEIALIAKAKQDELQLEIFYQQQRQALWDKDPKKVQEIQNQIDKIKAQSELVAAKAQTDGLRVQEKNLTQFFSKIKSAMDQSISGFLKGTESFSKAWQNMWSDMVVSMVQKLADMMLKWIEHHVAMLVIHTTEKEGEVAADGSAAAESKGISLADAIAKIHHSAAAAASRVYEAEAPLGPVIAGLLAAGTYTAVLGFKALASAEGGQYYVPNNQLTMLHAQEMVLPAGIANQMRNVISGGGSGGSGVTVVVNHSVSAVDAASFQGHIRRHSNMIANEVTRALKRKGVR